ncbi:hypothetical protein AB1N83_012807 [Pleurotus pulmonarius]
MSKSGGTFAQIQRTMRCGRRLDVTGIQLDLMAKGRYRRGFLTPWCNFRYSTLFSSLRIRFLRLIVVDGLTVVVTGTHSNST